MTDGCRFMFTTQSLVVEREDLVGDRYQVLVCRSGLFYVLQVNLILKSFRC